MKKTYILAAVLALPAFAGTPAEVYTAPASVSSPFAVEIGGTFRLAPKELFTVGPAKEVDVYGPEITGVYELTPNHAVTLRFGYNYGSEVMRASANDGSGDLWAETLYVHSFYLMPGYRYSAALSDNWSVFAGVSVGVTNMSMKEKWTCWSIDEGQSPEERGHMSDWGFAASAELGLEYKISESSYLYAAYEFYGNTTERRKNDEYWEGGGFSKQVYHSIRAGIGIRF